MVITNELVFQGLLLSSVFLMVLGLPKIIILTVWARWRIWTYENIGRISKYLTRWITEEQIDFINTPENQRNRIAVELSDYIGDVKKPLIESFSAAFFMYIATSNLDVSTSVSSLLSLLIIIIIIVAIFVAFFTFSCSIKLDLVKYPNISKKIEGEKRD